MPNFFFSPFTNELFILISNVEDIICPRLTFICSYSCNNHLLLLLLLLIFYKWYLSFLSFALVSFILQPHVDFGLKLIGADLMSIPGLYRIVQVNDHILKLPIFIFFP